MLPTTLDDYPNDILIGIDESARGSGIGDVCAAAVIWDPSYQPQTKEDEKCLNMIKDSKKLSPTNRDKLAEFIKKNAVDYAISTVDNNEIDKINILQATFKAMHMALDQIKAKFTRIVVDGNRFKTYMNSQGEFVPHTCIIRGDDTLLSIAAASILAKCHRDKMITDLHNSDERLKVYGWDKNKGYLTKQHMEAIREFGLTPYHRTTFIHI